MTRHFAPLPTLPADLTPFSELHDMRQVHVCVCVRTRVCIYWCGTLSAHTYITHIRTHALPHPTPSHLLPWGTTSMKAGSTPPSSTKFLLEYSEGVSNRTSGPGLAVETAVLPFSPVGKPWPRSLNEGYLCFICSGEGTVYVWNRDGEELYVYLLTRDGKAEVISVVCVIYNQAHLQYGSR